MIFEIFTSAPPPTDPPDYVPAIIGLGGVMLGGLIQVFAQRRAEVEKQVFAIRAECAELASAAGDYSSVMTQMVRVVRPAIAEFRVELKKNKKAQLNEFVDDDYWNRLGDSLLENFGAVYKKSLFLGASKDRRVSDQAMVVHHACTDAHNEAAPLMTGEKDITEVRAEELRDEIRLQASILLSMVEPRRIEKFLRFRRAESAHRQVKKLRSQTEVGEGNGESSAKENGPPQVPQASRAHRLFNGINGNDE